MNKTEILTEVGALLGRTVALSLARNHVNQPRAVHCENIVECVHQQIQIVTVYRSEVAKPQFFKEHAGHQQIF